MGFFVVIEGLNGVGKTSLAQKLLAKFRTRVETHLTEEPNTISCAGLFLKEVLRREKQADEWTQALAFAANRADHITVEINPFLEKYSEGILICDRYFHSSLVYQARNGISVDDIMFLNKFARKPDLTLYLDACPKIVANRLSKRSWYAERYDSNPEMWRERYSEIITYLKKQGHNIEKIDASKSLNSVTLATIQILKNQGLNWLAKACN